MNKSVRLLSVFLLLLLILGVCSVPAGAEGVYANIESAAVGIEIPEQFTVTSADATPNEEITYNATAVSADSTKQLVITSEKNENTQELYNFKYLSEEQVRNEVESIKQGSDTICGGYYENVSEAAFKEQKRDIVFNFYNSGHIDNKAVNSAVAYTLVNGELITIQYISTSGALTTEEKGVFNKIVDSITVTTLYEKPEFVDMSGIFGRVLVVVFLVGAVLVVTLAAYYLSNRRKSHKTSRQLADKYYSELEKEGLMDDDVHYSKSDKAGKTDKRTDTRIAKSEHIPRDNTGSISAVIDTYHQPTIIDDEWEDIDLEKMFAIPDDLGNTDDNVTSQAEETSQFDDYFASDSYVSSQPGRADSAKRYAKMFMGSDVENREKSNGKPSDPEYDEKMARIEERHRRRMAARKGSSNNKRKKRRNTTERTKSAVSRSSTSRRNPQPDDVFSEFEIDGYWDKYR